MGVQVIHSKNASIFSFTRKLFQVRKIVLPKPEKVAKDAILLVHGCGLCECVCARANATKMMHSETKSKRLWWCTIVIPAFFFSFLFLLLLIQFSRALWTLSHTHTHRHMHSRDASRACAWAKCVHACAFPKSSTGNFPLFFNLASLPMGCVMCRWQPISLSRIHTHTDIGHGENERAGVWKGCIL